jgi:hypothetical protein
MGELNNSLPQRHREHREFILWVNYSIQAAARKIISRRDAVNAGKYFRLNCRREAEKQR